MQFSQKMKLKQYELIAQTTFKFCVVLHTTNREPQYKKLH